MAKVYAGVSRVLRNGLGCPRQAYREGIEEKDLGHFLDRRRHIRRSRRENKVVELIDWSSVHLEKCAAACAPAIRPRFTAIINPTPGM